MAMRDEPPWRHDLVTHWQIDGAIGDKDKSVRTLLREYG
jgi:hypothetical protein